MWAQTEQGRVVTAVGAATGNVVTLCNFFDVVRISIAAAGGAMGGVNAWALPADTNTADTWTVLSFVPAAGITVVQLIFNPWSAAGTFTAGACQIFSFPYLPCAVMFSVAAVAGVTLTYQVEGANYASK